MRIEAVELRLVHLPLVRPFRTSFGTDSERAALVLRVFSGGVEGWGECVCGAEPLYSSEFIESAWLTLVQVLVPSLLAAGDVEPDAVAPILRAFKGHRMAKACLEMGVLDACLRAGGRSFHDYLGSTSASVRPGVAVGITDSVAELVQVVATHVEEGYTRIKLKIEPGWDLEPVRAVRSLVGDEMMLQVDANAAYARDDLEHLRKLDEFGLLLIEQPLDEEDLVGHVLLAERLSTPICLDESVVSAATAVQAIELGACSIVNVKPGRVGGYLEAKRIHDACRELGVPVWCGGMLETGIGRAGNLALAALPGFTLPGDVSATDRYFAEDITPPFVLNGGEITVPDGPGLGVEVDKAVLDRLTGRREVIAAG